MLSFTILPCHSQHAPAAKQVHTEAVNALEGKYYDRDQIKAWTAGDAAGMEKSIQRSAGGYVAISPENPEIIYGYGLLSPEGNEVWQLYVRPAFWKRGIGKTLLMQLEDKIFMNHEQSILLSNHFSKEFYENMGYAMLCWPCCINRRLSEIR